MTTWARVKTRDRCDACLADYAAYHRDPSVYARPPRAEPATYRHNNGRRLCARHHAEQETTP